VVTVHINEVTVRRARLLLRWVTVCRYDELEYVPAIQANSASYPQWDEKWVPAKKQ